MRVEKMKCTKKSAVYAGFTTYDCFFIIIIINILTEYILNAVELI